MFVTKTQNNMSQVIDVLKPCTVTYTSNSVYIKTKDRTYIFTSSGTMLKPTELHFVKQFRKYYVDNPKLDFDKRYVNVHPNYFKFYKEKGTYHNIVEIDINRAYPSAGKILRIIPDYLYEKGMEYSKLAFLVAIGSLYRKKKTIKITANGTRKLISNEERDPQLSKIWRSIVGFTDHAMQSVIATKKRSVYFYWCDALFVKKEDEEHFVNGLKAFGFEVKTKDIDKITYTDEKALVYYDGVVEPKEFSKPVRKYLIEDIDSLIKRYERNRNESKLESSRQTKKKLVQSKKPIPVLQGSGKDNER